MFPSGPAMHYMTEGLMRPEARLRIQPSHAGGGHGTAVVTSRDFESQVEQAVSRSTNWLLSAQEQEGYWWGELEADTTLESDYILLHRLLGTEDQERTLALLTMVLRSIAAQESFPMVQTHWLFHRISLREW